MVTHLGSGNDVRGLDLVVEPARGGLVHGHAPVVESEKSSFFFRSGCVNRLLKEGSVTIVVRKLKCLTINLENENFHKKKNLQVRYDLSRVSLNLIAL